MTNSEHNTTRSGQARRDDVYRDLFTTNTGDGAGPDSSLFESDAQGNLVQPPSVSEGWPAIGHTITAADIDRLPALPGESLVGEQKPAGTTEHGQSNSRDHRSANSAAGSAVAQSSLPDDYKGPRHSVTIRQDERHRSTWWRWVQDSTTEWNEWE